MDSGVRGGGSDLLERERELAELEVLTTGAAGGGGGFALIEGPAGIGKTRLLVEARREGEENGMLVLNARSGEFEAEFPYGVVRQLFEPVLGAEGAASPLLAGAAAAAAPVFDPESDPGTDGGAFATLHGLYWLALNLAAEQPLMLTVDDLQWGDPASLRFLAYLSRRLEGTPILVAATLRNTDPGTDPGLIAEIGADPLTTSLAPAPLTPDAVSEVTEARLGAAPDPAFSAACLRATGGNPLLLRELLAALAADGVTPDAANAAAVNEIGPRAVSRSVLLRLSRLSAEASAAARAAAVLGEGADVAQIAAMSGLEPERAADATGELARAEILRPDLPLGFVHPLVREAVYLDVAPGDRQLQHARAAEVLSQGGASLEATATHVLLTAPRGSEATVDLLRSAARSAMHKGAPDSAAAYLRRALSEPPDPEDVGHLTLELGLAEALFDPPAAVQSLGRARSLLPDPPEQALTAMVQAPIMILTGSEDEGRALADAVASSLPAGMEEEKRRLQAIGYTAIQFAAGEPADDEDLAPHRRLPLPPGGGAKMLASIAALRWSHSGGSAADCAELAVAATTGDEVFEADGGFVSVSSAEVLALAERDEAVTVLERMRADAYRKGSLFLVSGVLLFSGFTWILRGDLAAAESDLTEGAEHFRRWGFTNAFFDAFMAITRLYRGDVAGARAELGRSSDPGDWSEGARYWVMANIETMLAEGRNEEVVAATERVGDRFSYLRNPEFGRWRSARAQALARLGRSREEPGLLDEELANARVWGAPGTVGATLRVRGELAGAAGIGDLEEAVATLEASTARLELARALASLGTAIRLDRRPSEAREPLGRALEMATACSADGLVEHCRTELHATGARPRREALSGVESLTPSERRVADLAADGMTNREIAQTLYVTPKTVEVHLSNGYRKLDIRSRRELPRALGAAA